MIINDPPKKTKFDYDNCTELRALYLELLMAVQSKFPNESRHQTALRYIQEKESIDFCSSKENHHATNG